MDELNGRDLAPTVIIDSHARAAMQPPLPLGDTIGGYPRSMFEKRDPIVRKGNNGEALIRLRGAMGPSEEFTLTQFLPLLDQDQLRVLITAAQDAHDKVSGATKKVPSIADSFFIGHRRLPPLPDIDTDTGASDPEPDDDFRARAIKEARKGGWNLIDLIGSTGEKLDAAAALHGIKRRAGTVATGFGGEWKRVGETMHVTITPPRAAMEISGQIPLTQDGETIDPAGVDISALQARSRMHRMPKAPQAPSSPCPCGGEHEPVEMIFKRFCKKCDCDLT